MKPIAGIVLLHGALGSGAEWTPLLTELSAMHKVIAPNFPGHAHGPYSGSIYSLSQLVQFVGETISTEFNGEPVIVLGHSMGGYVALKAALSGNEQIAGVITLGTKLHWSTQIVEKETKLLDAEIMLSKVPKFAAMLGKIHGTDNWKPLLSNIASLLTELGETNPLATEQLSDLQIPVRIMLGDRDEMVSVEESLAAYRAINTATFSMLPATPHPLFKVNPQRLAFEVADFIGQFS